jgi:hypothetical protein
MEQEISIEIARLALRMATEELATYKQILDCFSTKTEVLTPKELEELFLEMAKRNKLTEIEKLKGENFDTRTSRENLEEK